MIINQFYFYLLFSTSYLHLLRRIPCHQQQPELHKTQHRVLQLLRLMLQVSIAIHRQDN